MLHGQGCPIFLSDQMWVGPQYFFNVEYRYGRARVIQWWEHSPPTIVAWVQTPRWRQM